MFAERCQTLKSEIYFNFSLSTSYSQIFVVPPFSAVNQFRGSCPDSPIKALDAIYAFLSVVPSSMSVTFTRSTIFVSANVPLVSTKKINHKLLKNDEFLIKLTKTRSRLDLRVSLIDKLVDYWLLHRFSCNVRKYGVGNIWRSEFSIIRRGRRIHIF